MDLYTPTAAMMDMESQVKGNTIAFSISSFLGLSSISDGATLITHYTTFLGTVLMLFVLYLLLPR